MGELALTVGLGVMFVAVIALAVSVIRSGGPARTRSSDSVRERGRAEAHAYGERAADSMGGGT